jgi:hypothetical protein
MTSLANTADNGDSLATSVIVPQINLADVSPFANMQKMPGIGEHSFTVLSVNADSEKFDLSDTPNDYLVPIKLADYLPPIKFADHLTPLKALSHWILWRYNSDKSKKEPYSPITGYLIDPTNPKNGTSYEVAIKAYQNGGFDGIGFILSKETGLIGLDFDWKGRKGEGIPQCVNDILHKLGSYAEVTPSGKGIRIWFCGVLPQGLPIERGYGKTDLEPGVSIEVYHSKSYFTVTEKPVEGYNQPINNDQGKLNWLVDNYLTKPPVVNKSTTVTSISMSVPSTNVATVEVVVTLGCTLPNNEKFSALMSGDTTDYNNNHSRADLALCGLLFRLCGNNEALIDSVFRASGLFRSKWDKKHNVQGFTYGQMTISKARQGWNGSTHRPIDEELHQVTQKWQNPDFWSRLRGLISPETQGKWAAKKYRELISFLESQANKNLVIRHMNGFAILTGGSRNVTLETKGDRHERIAQLHTLKREGLIGGVSKKNPHDRRSSIVVVIPADPNDLDCWSATHPPDLSPRKNNKRGERKTSQKPPTCNTPPVLSSVYYSCEVFLSPPLIQPRVQTLATVADVARLIFDGAEDFGVLGKLTGKTDNTIRSHCKVLKDHGVLTYKKKRIVLLKTRESFEQILLAEREASPRYRRKVESNLLESRDYHERVLSNDPDRIVTGERDSQFETRRNDSRKTTAWAQSTLAAVRGGKPLSEARKAGRAGTAPAQTGTDVEVEPLALSEVEVSPPFAVEAVEPDVVEIEPIEVMPHPLLKHGLSGTIIEWEEGQDQAGEVENPTLSDEFIGQMPVLESTNSIAAVELGMITINWHDLLVQLPKALQYLKDENIPSVRMVAYIGDKTHIEAVSDVSDLESLTAIVGKVQALYTKVSRIELQCRARWWTGELQDWTCLLGQGKRPRQILME